MCEGPHKNGRPVAGNRKKLVANSRQRGRSTVNLCLPSGHNVFFLSGKMMTKIKHILAPLLSLALGMPILGLAKSSDFSAGFNSSKSSSSDASSKPADAARTSPSAAGSTTKSTGSANPAKGFSNGFKSPTSTTSSGGSTPNPAAAPDLKSNSALSKSLQKSTANTNALATLDARNAKKALVTGAVVGAGTVAVVSAVDTAGQTSTGSPPQPNYHPPAPVVRDSGSDSMGNALWFMLGRSTSNDRTVSVNNGQSPNFNSTSPSPNGYVPSTGGTNSAADEDSGSSILRVFLWLLIIGAVIAGVLWYKARRDSANGGSKSKRNYSL